MKKTLLFAASALVVLTLAPAAQAQLIVNDPISLAKNLAEWKSQIDEMKKQYSQGQELLSSLNDISGVNDIASLLNDRQLRQFLPEDAQALGRSINGDWSSLGAIGDRASEIRDANRLFRPGEALNENQQASFDDLERSGNLAARDIAVGEAVDQAANRRLEGIEELRRALDTAPNARAVMDIQARIAAETALLQNDNMRLQGQAMRASAERELENQRERERRLAASEARRAVYARRQ